MNDKPIDYIKVNLLSKYLYFFLLIILYLFWFFEIYFNDYWPKVIASWPATVTMVFGSFVAGATSEGGGFVAFPVFTKVLKWSAEDATTFALMIQSIGMSFATIFILINRIRILKRVILISTMGGFLGLFCGFKYVHLHDPWPKLFFTFMVTSFAIVLLITKYLAMNNQKLDIDTWSPQKIITFFIFGVLGGVISSKVGIGINIILFILLTLAFSINEKISTPTTVVVMALLSIFGFVYQGIHGQITPMYSYWLAAIPVVCFGAPLGAYFSSKVPQSYVVNLLLVLIFIEFFTTLLLIKMTAVMFMYAITIMFLSALVFCCMLLYRNKHNCLPLPYKQNRAVKPLDLDKR